MERFCDQLRLERERRNISLDRICEITKVSPRHLRALEAGDFEILPGGIFRKGILRNYLAVLGLDEAEWMPHFAAELGCGAAPLDDPARLAEFAEAVQRARGHRTAEHDLRWLGVAFMASTVAVLGWCVWHFTFRNHVILSSLLLGEVPFLGTRGTRGSLFLLTSPPGDIQLSVTEISSRAPRT